MAQSREEFMRQLGLTGDDVADPKPSAKRRDVAPEEYSNNAHNTSSSSFTTRSTPARAPPTQTSPSRGGYEASASAYSSTMETSAAFARGGYPSAPPPEPQPARRPPPPDDDDKADFLRAMGIDNYQSGGGTDDNAGSKKSHAELVAERRAARRGGNTSSTNASPNPYSASAFSSQKENQEPTMSSSYQQQQQQQQYQQQPKPHPQSTAESVKEALRRAERGDDGPTTSGEYYSQQRDETIVRGDRPSQASNIRARQSTEPILGLSGEALNPDASADELKSLGNKFYERGDYRKAVRLYTKAIEKDPNNGALYSNRSAAYLQGGKQMGIDTRTMALRDGDMAVKLKPNWFKGYSRRGDALFKLDRLEEAKAAYLEGLECDPGNAALTHSISECNALLPTKKGPPGASYTTGLKKHTDKNAYELLAETEIPDGVDYKERELERYRTHNSSSSFNGGARSSTPSNNNNTSSASINLADPTAPTPTLNRSAIPEEFGTGAAYQYQSSLLEEYRKKKAAKAQGSQQRY